MPLVEQVLAKAHTRTHAHTQTNNQKTLPISLSVLIVAQQEIGTRTTAKPQQRRMTGKGSSDNRPPRQPTSAVKVSRTALAMTDSPEGVTVRKDDWETETEAVITYMCKTEGERKMNK